MVSNLPERSAAAACCHHSMAARLTSVVNSLGRMARSSGGKFERPPLSSVAGSTGIRIQMKGSLLGPLTPAPPSEEETEMGALVASSLMILVDARPPKGGTPC